MLLLDQTKEFPLVLRQRKSGQYFKRVGDTGFKSVAVVAKATPFESVEQIETFKRECGITWPTDVVQLIQKGTV